MLYKFARFLQLLGLLICPVGIAGNVIEKNGEPLVPLKVSLMIASIGVLVFALGWLLQQSVRPR
jgi:hypothetical protein